MSSMTGKGTLFIDGQFVATVHRIELQQETEKYVSGDGSPRCVSTGAFVIKVTSAAGELTAEEIEMRRFKRKLDLNASYGKFGQRSPFYTSLKRAIYAKEFPRLPVPPEIKFDLGVDPWLRAQPPQELPRSKCVLRGPLEACGTHSAMAIINPEKEIQMKSTQLLNLLQTEYNTVTVSFEGGHYKFKCDKAIQLAPFDHVVCDTARGFALGVVYEVVNEPVLQGNDAHEWKWIVSKVDFTGHELRKKQESEFKKSMADVELLRKQDEALKQYRNSLPEGSAARQVFENAVAAVAVTAAPEIK